MSKKEPFPIVYVKWDDAYACASWKDLEDYEMEGMEVETVGYLVKKDRRFIRIASSLSKNRTQGSDFTTIPRKMILELRELKGGRR